MKNETRHISSLKNWEKNPRGILKDDFERLKKQIQKFGQYKPLLITEDGTVLGGNMRLKAMQDLGITDVWVSVVDAPDEKTKLEYALSDNDRAGYYETQELTELVYSLPDLKLDEYKVDFSKNVLLSDVMERLTYDPIKEWKGMPEFTQESKQAFRSVIVHFNDQESVERFFIVIDRKYTDQTKYIWYPEDQRMDTESKRYG